MKVIGIIPARMGSTRFPGKPLAKIVGKPMIYHVYKRSAKAAVLDAVYIATPDKEIEDYCKEQGMNVVMTKDTHQRCSDRTAEAMLAIEGNLGLTCDIVVMIQGDEPMVYPEMIEQAVKPFTVDSEIQVVNLMAKLKTRQEHDDPNEVKVVVDNNNCALYFSREPIPSWKKQAKQVPMLKQVCIIPFRRDFLLKFNQLTPTSLEIIESVDMLRVLEHGYKVQMVPTEFNTYSVDTPGDLEVVEQMMSNDLLVAKY